MTASNFVTRHNLWTADQQNAADEIKAAIKEYDIKTIRVSFADQHGILRGKSIIADAFDSILYNGCGLTTTLLLKDTSHHTAFPVWQSGGGLDLTEMTGACDFLMVPDPATFRILPWAEDTAWVLCDCYYPDGRPVPFSTRRILQEASVTLSQAGYSFVSGIELEFSIYKLDDPRLTHQDSGHPASPPLVSPLAHGFQYLTETRYDELAPVFEILRETLIALGLPLRTMEAEFGPSQAELTFEPVAGCEGADNVILARSAIKQVCRRHGYHATFMCRPALPNAFSNGWHLHQSLVDIENGKNVFASANTEELLSPVGSQYLAGLLEHAKEAAIFLTPTINGYKRYRPFTLAPTRIVWGKDNRGAMFRVVGRPGDTSTHIENRGGEPAANPYLYFTSQMICGLHGIQTQLSLPDAVDTPYDNNWERLPRNIYEAISCLKESSLFREALGDAFIDYFITIKEFELNRFLSEEVTDWEQREYFENF